MDYPLVAITSAATTSAATTSVVNSPVSDESDMSCTSVMAKIREAVENGYIKEYRRLLTENRYTSSEVRCSCGCIEYDTIYKLLRNAGRIEAAYYSIAFETGHLATELSLEDSCQTTEMILHYFSYMPDGDTEAEQNIMGTLDVFKEKLGENELGRLVWPGVSRAEQEQFNRFDEYPAGLPDIFYCNIMTLAIQGMCLNTTKDFKWKIVLKLYDMGVPFPDYMSQWDDTDRPIPSENDGASSDEGCKKRYIRVLRAMTPIQAIVENGGLYALKGLYERDPEMVRKGLTNSGPHIEEFRNTIVYWQTKVESWKVEEDPVTREEVEIPGKTYYEKYHNNANEILEEMKLFIANITNI
jgi:hypothetical protein